MKNPRQKIFGFSIFFIFRKLWLRNCIEFLFGSPVPYHSANRYFWVLNKEYDKKYLFASVELGDKDY